MCLKHIFRWRQKRTSLCRGSKSLKLVYGGSIPCLFGHPGLLIGRCVKQSNPASSAYGSMFFTFAQMFIVLM